MESIEAFLQDIVFKVLSFIFAFTIMFLCLIRVISNDRMREILFNPKFFCLVLYSSR